MLDVDGDVLSSGGASLAGKSSLFMGISSRTESSSWKSLNAVCSSGQTMAYLSSMDDMLARFMERSDPESPSVKIDFTLPSLRAWVAI